MKVAEKVRKSDDLAEQLDKKRLFRRYDTEKKLRDSIGTSDDKKEFLERPI